ncbi:MAG: carbohydrate kinase family protein [Cyanobacteriota bacterium]
MSSSAPPQILCLGEILFDDLADQPGLPLAAVQSWSAYPGGASANVACGLVKLGTAAGFIGCVGEDAAGDALTQVLIREGVNIQGLQRHPQAPTRRVYVTRSLEGDRSFAGFGAVATTAFADAQLRGDLIPADCFTRAEYLVLGTIPLAYPQSRGAAEQALSLAQSRGTQIVVDLNWRPVFWPDQKGAIPLIQTLLEQADFLKCADEEAQWFFNTQDLAAIQRRYPRLRGILLTAGERGCRYLLGETQGKVPAFTLPVVDTTGAGDAFLAGFLCCALRDGVQLLTDPDAARQAICYASAVGALTTLGPGAIAPQPRSWEVEHFLQFKQLPTRPWESE